MQVLGGMPVTGDARDAHTPVLVREVLDLLGAGLGLEAGSFVVDATLGAGGHSEAILDAFPDCRLVGIDQDQEILALAHARLERFGDRVRIHRARMSGLAELLQRESLGRPAALLMDLGVSSLQLDSRERGFSFQEDGPLDMRMDPSRERTAADIVNHWDESDLADLFYYEAGETRSRKIARAIVEARRRAPFLRTLALADTVERACVGRGPRGGKLHPATRTFQALRRAVNEESEELLAGLDAAEDWLANGGRLVVISFHSGEDGAVKRFIADGVRRGRWSSASKKSTGASAEETRANPRSRSARVRAALRVRGGGIEAGCRGYC